MDSELIPVYDADGHFMARIRRDQLVLPEMLIWLLVVQEGDRIALPSERGWSPGGDWRSAG